jgi:hypothetical protein
VGRAGGSVAVGGTRVAVGAGCRVAVSVTVGAVVAVTGIAVAARVAVLGTSVGLGTATGRSAVGRSTVGGLAAAGRLTTGSVATRATLTGVGDPVGMAMVTSPRTTASIVRLGVGCGISVGTFCARA